MRPYSLARLTLVLGAIVLAACTSTPGPVTVIPTNGVLVAEQPTDTRVAATMPPAPTVAPTASEPTPQPTAVAANSTGIVIQAGRTRPPVIAGLTPAPVAGDAAEMAEKVLADLDQSLHPSIAVRVELTGKPIIDKAWGYADRQAKRPLSVNSRFRIGSISKSITAMGVLLLQEERKLNVQDRVCKYVSDCPAAWESVTVHHLLTHTSGIPDYRFLPGYGEWRKMAHPIPEVVDVFREERLVAPPGTAYNYSNSGFVLAAYIIERVSGMSYEEYLRKALLAPLGMTNTGLFDPGPEMAVGSMNFRPPDEVVTNHSGAGGLYSTTGDLAIWARAVMGGPALPARARDLMLADHVQFKPAPEAEWYGYGIGGGIRHGHLAFGHDGEVEGFRGDWNVYPDIGGVITFLTNEDRVDTGALWLDLEAQLFR